MGNRNIFKLIAFINLIYNSINAFAQYTVSDTIKSTLISDTLGVNKSFYEIKNIHHVNPKKRIIVAQFNLNLSNEFDLMLGPTGVIEDLKYSIVNIRFRLTNLNEQMIYNTNNELHDYLIIKLREKGYKVDDYKYFVENSLFSKLKPNKSLKGDALTNLKSYFSAGYPLKNKDIKYISFSAYGKSPFDCLGPNSLFLTNICKKIDHNILSFGLSLNFIEWDGVKSNLYTADSFYRARLFANNTEMYFHLPENNIAYIKEINYGISLNKKFVKELRLMEDNIKIENQYYRIYDVIIDNYLLKENILLLGKKYIDAYVNELHSKKKKSKK